MLNITIGRFDQDPEAQGIVRPDDDRWQLIIDKDGIPHLYVRVFTVLDGKRIAGYMAIDDVLAVHEDEDGNDEPLTMAGLVDAEMGGELTPEEEAEAHEQMLANRERNPVPFPRYKRVQPNG